MKFSTINQAVQIGEFSLESAVLKHLFSNQIYFLCFGLKSFSLIYQIICRIFSFKMFISNVPCYNEKVPKTELNKRMEG